MFSQREFRLKHSAKSCLKSLDEDFKPKIRSRSAEDLWIVTYADSAATDGMGEGSMTRQFEAITV